MTVRRRLPRESRRASDGELGNGATRVLLAVLAGDRTVQALCRRLHISQEVAYRHMTTLRAMGLVTWETGRKGTLRPLVTVVTDVRL